jgi:hypothetical protein
MLSRIQALMRVNNGMTALIALLIGWVLGMATLAYIAFAWMSPNARLGSGANPAQLFSTGTSAQYRDYYAARAASRFAALGGAGQPVALEAARDELGVSNSDVSPAEAAAMVRAAQLIAIEENKEANPDGGRFTLADQQNLTALADTLDSVKDQQYTPVLAPVSQTPLRLIGALALLFGGFLGGFLLWWLLSQGGSLGERVQYTRERVAGYRPVRSQQPVAYDEQEDIEDEASDDPDALVEPAPVRGTARPLDPYDDEPLTVPPMGARNAAPMTETVAPRAQTPSSTGQETLISTYETHFRLGDDNLDDGHPINGSMGELIGECGVTGLERIGLDSPHKWVALSIWVFDKNDFQSTTKVLMTDYAYNDAVMTDKVKNRGASLLARNGAFDIVTSTMRVDVEVSALDFGAIGSEPSGFFENLQLRFKVYRKA